MADFGTLDGSQNAAWAEPGTRTKLKDAGLRITGPRRKVLELFERSEERHLSAEMVYQELTGRNEQASIATIYRVLAQFEAVGILIRHQLESGTSVFELSRSGQHSHLVCLDCGLMTCFNDESISSCLGGIAKQHGFDVESYTLNTHVRCTQQNCPRREVSKSRA